MGLFDGNFPSDVEKDELLKAVLGFLTKCATTLCTVHLMRAALFIAFASCLLLHTVQQYSTVQYCTVRYGTVLYCTVLYGTVLYGTVLYCTVLYLVLTFA